jgi:tryptophan synthase alpha chain
MSKFIQLFSQVIQQERPAYIPFLMLGDPSIELSLKVIDAVIAGGADALELGIPFSDPVADGPTIQQAANRARQQGVTPLDCFKMIQDIRQRYPAIPIGLLVYANLVYHQGIAHFYQQASAAGVDAVLIPDVPTEEAFPFVTEAKNHGIHPILLATPTCLLQDLQNLADLSEGFTYVVTRPGVTGTERESEFTNAKKMVEQLQVVNAPSPVFGFGIKNAHDVHQAYLHGAKGVIIGSGLIHAISKMSPKIIHEGTEITLLTKKLFCLQC